MLAVLIQIDAYDPVGAAAETLRACSVDDPRVCHLNGQRWWPVLGELPKLRYDFFSGSFDGRIETPSSSLTLLCEPFPTLPQLMLADARVQIWTGTVGDAWGSYTQRFDGIVTAQPAITDLAARIEIAVDDRWLDEPLLDLYAGSGGLEGDAAMKGTPKPLALGDPDYVPGVMIDATNFVAQLSAYGEVQAISTAMERLVRFGASTGNYASLAALVAAAIPAGGWGTCRANGLVRHGAGLTGLASYLMSGDKAGADGWVRTPGKLIKRLCEIRGHAARVSETSVDALDVARPWNLSLYFGDQLTIRDAVQRVAASVNAAVGVSWLGELFAVPIDLNPTPAVELRSDGTALPIVGDVAQLAGGAPWWRLGVQAQRAWAVHGQSDIAYADDPGALAIAAIAEIASDSLLTPGEKPIAIKEYAAITTEQGGIDAQATAYSITTEKTAYDNAVTALTTYLGTLTSAVAWNNLTGNTTISGATFRAKFNDVYIARQALLNKIDQVAGTKATWTGIPSSGGGPSGSDVAGTVNSGGGVATNKVATVAIINNSVSQTTMQVMGGTLTGSGAYAWQDAISYTLTPAYTASAIFVADIGQGYSSGVLPQSWEVRILVDGALIAGKGGAGWGSDSATVSGGVTGLSAAGHTIKLQWRGDNVNLSLVSANLTITHTMK